jgi:hypothetical protein
MQLAPPARSAAPHFPVVWREGDHASAVGELIVERDVLRFEGSSGGEPASARVLFTEIREVRVARAPERPNGRPTVVLERDSAPFSVEPVGAGLLGEMASLLTLLHEEGARRAKHVAVVVPLRVGTEERIAELLESGPPFELAVRGIRSHQVHVGPREAVFVFGGPDVRAVLERAIGDPALWRAGLAWRNVMAGRPRVVECSFSWTAPPGVDGL